MHQQRFQKLLLIRNHNNFLGLLTIITITRKQVIFARMYLLLSVISLSCFGFTYLGFTELITPAKPTYEPREKSVMTEIEPREQENWSILHRAVLF
jgi:hypothetical protein